MVFYQFVCWIVIYVIFYMLFCFYFIIVSYSYIIYLIVEMDDQYILRVCLICINVYLNGNFVLGVFVFLVIYYYFVVDVYMGIDMFEFVVIMGGLIQIYEVYIYGILRNFFIELSVQM